MRDGRFDEFGVSIDQKDETFDNWMKKRCDEAKASVQSHSAIQFSGLETFDDFSIFNPQFMERKCKTESDIIHYGDEQLKRIVKKLKQINNTAIDEISIDLEWSLAKQKMWNDLQSNKIKMNRMWKMIIM